MNQVLLWLEGRFFQSKEGEAQIRRMKEVVQHVLYNSVDRAKSVCSEIMDWIDLYSIHDVPMGRNLAEFTKNISNLRDSPIRQGKSNWRWQD